MARARVAVAAAAVALLALAAPARAEVRIAVYAPWAGPSTASDRHALGLELAAAIETAGLGKATVASFAKMRDFERALARGAVDLALVDSGAAGSLGRRMRVTASWSSGARWVLAGIDTGGQLNNKRLALQAHDAAWSRQLIRRLLRGQASARYFARLVGAPVTADAVQLVTRRRADVVIVPAQAAGDLTEIVDLGRWSELALAVRTGNSALQPIAAELQRALRDQLGGSWTAGQPRLPAPVAPTRPARAPLAAERVSIFSLFAPIDTAPPPLPIGELWIEPDDD
jgi:hypothetical protein